MAINFINMNIGKIKINLNTWSSLLFVSNIIHLWGKNESKYLVSWIILCSSSIIYHQTKNKYILIIDKLAIYNVTYNGLICFLKYEIDLIQRILITLTFVHVCILYFIGYLYSKFIYDKIYGQRYHVLMHFIGCVGHHLITYNIKKI